mmetsp:Transcript_15055/g.32874  ORF Transcript_15055/g.32874 Transcript_15055/m.32874 type:complete len:224 (+) Transcript_15055:556-1227(+)
MWLLWLIRPRRRLHSSSWHPSRPTLPTTAPGAGSTRAAPAVSSDRRPPRGKIPPGLAIARCEFARRPPRVANSRAFGLACARARRRSVRSQSVERCCARRPSRISCAPVTIDRVRRNSPTGDNPSPTDAAGLPARVSTNCREKNPDPNCQRNTGRHWPFGRLFGPCSRSKFRRYRRERRGRDVDTIDPWAIDPVRWSVEREWSLRCTWQFSTRSVRPTRATIP